MKTDLNKNFLSSEVELKLIKEYRDGKDEAIILLLNSQRGLVKKIVNDYIIKNPELERDDLIQEGTIGLLDAINKFDETRNCRLTTYAYPYIKNSVDRYIVYKTKMILLPNNKVEGYKKYISFIIEYKNMTGEMPDDDFIKEYLNINDEILELFKGVNNLKPISLDQKILDESGDTIMSTLKDEKDSYKDVDDFFDVKFLLYRIKNHLTDWQYLMFYNKYLNGEKVTDVEVGAYLGITKNCVRQTMKTIIEDIKTMMSNDNMIDVSIADIDKINLAPLTVDEIIQLYYIKGLLDPYEYYIYYNSRYGEKTFSKLDLARNLNLDLKSIDILNKGIDERVNPVLSVNEKQFAIMKDNFFNTTSVNKALKEVVDVSIDEKSNNKKKKRKGNKR